MPAPRLRKLLLKLLAVCCLSATSASAQSKPLKVFILAGQSNMERHAKVETFDYIGDDPATAPLLKLIRGEDGQPCAIRVNGRFGANSRG